MILSNQYLIDPFLIYLINNGNNIRLVIVTLAIASAFTSIVFHMLVKRYIDTDDEVKVKKYFKGQIISLVLTFVFFAFATIFPNEESLYKIAINTVITQDNFHEAEGCPIEFIDYIYNEIHYKEIEADCKED